MGQADAATQRRYDHAYVTEATAIAEDLSGFLAGGDERGAAAQQG
jgi:hypothetical protein